MGCKMKLLQRGVARSRNEDIKGVRSAPDVTLATPAQGVSVHHDTSTLHHPLPSPSAPSVALAIWLTLPPRLRVCIAHCMPLSTQSRFHVGNAIGEVDTFGRFVSVGLTVAATWPSLPAAPRDQAP